MDEFNYDLEYIATGSSEKEWNEEKQVNEPQIEGTGLQPVTIKEGDGTITEIKDSKTSWYNYKTESENGLAKNTWANAISNSTSEEYKSYWVWIPRFAYKLTKSTDTKGEIEIVFLKGTTDNPASKTSKGEDTKDIVIKRASEVSTEDDDSEGNVYIVHPAFTNESGNGYANGGWDREIPGFWMAKFEAGYVGEYEDSAKKAKDSPVQFSTIMTWDGSTSKNNPAWYYGEDRTVSSTAIKWPTFQPCRPSMNRIGISDAYELCRKIGDKDAENNPYQLSNVDSHLIKNSEWGAVAYLSYSDYGRGDATEITINNISAEGSETIWAVTGYGASGVSSATQKIENLEEYINPGSSSGPAGIWYSNQGQKASTTGNTSGVYDMVGGAWEWTAGYVDIGSGNVSTYGGKLRSEANGKYKSIYAHSNNGRDPSQNYSVESNKKRKGEAIWETSTQGNTASNSWNSDYSSFVDSGAPFTIRGGRWNDGADAGVFAFGRGSGYCYYNIGFRPVLVCE